MSLLVHGDALDCLRLMPSASANVIPTSPPYLWQRDYGVDGQIGQEKTREEYLERLWALSSELWRVLVPTGTLWVNIGDKYRSKQRMLIPERYAAGMQDRGWLLRNYIVWHKLNPKPESIRSRFPHDWEAILLFVKQEKHYFVPLFEPYAVSSVRRCETFVKNGERFDPLRHKHDPANVRQAAMRITERVAKNLCIPGKTPDSMHIERNAGRGRNLFDARGRRMRCVWSLPVGRYRGAHYATWPPELARRMILAGCPPGGVVLDPFLGSGTTIAVAEELGRVGIGIELNPTYLELARQRILEAREQRAMKRKSLTVGDW